jgi:hypothetical protein
MDVLLIVDRLSFIVYRCYIPLSRYILDKPCVGGVILGIRPGLSDHVKENLKVFQFSLDNVDCNAIEQIVAKGYPLPGDCGDEYRM